MGETRKRIIVKKVSWGAVAIVNSFLILAVSEGGSNLLNALLMNCTGAAAYYFFNRLWVRINYGKVIELPPPLTQTQLQLRKDKIDKETNQRQYIAKMMKQNKEKSGSVWVAEKIII